VDRADQALGDPHRLASGARRVAVGVERLRLRDRLHERIARPCAVGRAEPVCSDLCAGPAVSLDCLGELPAQRAAAHPRHLRIERLARERVTKRRSSAAALLLQHAGLQQLCQTRLARESADQRQLERQSRDGRRLGRRARLRRQLGGGDHDRLADRVGHRHLVAVSQLEAAPAAVQPACDLQGR